MEVRGGRDESASTKATGEKGKEGGAVSVGKRQKKDDPD